MPSSPPQTIQAPLMRHVQTPQFLAEKLRRDVVPAVDEILAISSRSPALESDVSHLLAPLALRVRALSRLCGVPEVGQRLPDAIERLAQKIASLENSAFRELPSFQHFYRGRGERIWTCSAGLFSATRAALDAAAKMDPSLWERYLGVDRLPASPTILTRDGHEL